MSFAVSEMSFTVSEMSLAILAEMSFGQNAQKKACHVVVHLMKDIIPCSGVGRYSWEFPDFQAIFPNSRERGAGNPGISREIPGKWSFSGFPFTGNLKNPGKSTSLFILEFKKTLSSAGASGREPW